MSSDLLLVARRLTKSYLMSPSPRERFIEALFGWKPTKPSRTVLSDVTVEVARGETLGIMGRNGAGKTTLLGILGNVIEATSGSVDRNGRVAVLLAVGAGFNAQFTGRENAELFCSMMGLSRAETASRTEQIVEFAELSDYFDMPFRTYSSGMSARLGFACAIHVDADVIIIDETLAVGDASFRVKCYERIKLMQSGGQTFLLVSHSPNLIANFCNRTIVLERGQKVFDGRPLDGLNCYKDIRERLTPNPPLAGSMQSGQVNAGRLSLDGINFEEIAQKNRPNTCVLTCDLVASFDVKDPVVGFGVRNHEGITVCSFDSGQGISVLKPLKAGDRLPLKLEFTNLLLPGAYFISARIAERIGDVTVTLATHYNVARFDVVGPASNGGIVNLGMSLATEPTDVSLVAVQ